MAQAARNIIPKINRYRARNKYTVSKHVSIHEYLLCHQQGQSAVRWLYSVFQCVPYGLPKRSKVLECNDFSIKDILKSTKNDVF